MAFSTCKGCPCLTKRNAWLLLLLCFSSEAVLSQSRKPSKTNTDSFPAIAVKIYDHLKVFDDSGSIGARYFISICADVPYNKKPLQVAYKQETGHVFLILQKVDMTRDTICSVFGFYPRTGLQTLLFKRTRSVIKDNSYREYDVAITRELSAAQFDTVRAKSILYSKKKYHMNRYNCYDYAIDIFNSVADKDSLAILHVKFPSIFGRGGSPSSVYRAFREIVDSGSHWSPYIRFGEMVAPVSTARRAKLTTSVVVNQ